MRSVKSDTINSRTRNLSGSLVIARSGSTFSLNTNTHDVAKFITCFVARLLTSMATPRHLVLAASFGAADDAARPDAVGMGLQPAVGEKVV